MKITDYLKLSVFELDKDGQMFGRTWLSIFAGSGENNLKVIDDYAKKMNDTVTLIRNSPAVLSMSAKKETVGTYTADVPLIPIEKTDLTKNGIYIVSLNVTNETAEITLRINGTITKQLKKINQVGAVVHLEIGDLVAGLEHLFKYNGTNLVLINVNALTFMNHRIEDFVLKSEVVDDVVSTDTNMSLSANQGKLLDEKIDATETTLDTKIDSINTTLTNNIDAVESTLDTKIDNAKAELQGNIDLKAPIESPTFTGTVSGITKEMVGLANVTPDAQVKRSEMGVSGGVATLNESGQIPSLQLPSYIDDVLEFELKSQLPNPGESGKIYLVYGDTDLDNGQYRWTGTQYGDIPKSFALGETSNTAYAGDKGKKNADDIAVLNTNKVDKLTTAINGNVVIFGDGGNVVDSKKNVNDFAPATITEVIDNKINKLAEPFEVENIPILTSDGSISDSGKKLSDLAPAGNYALKTELPTKTSQLTNDSNFPVDANYVHTDNNYNAGAKAEVAKVAAKATTVTYSATLAEANWTAGTAPYAWQQSVSVAGMLSTDNPIADQLLQGTTAETIETEQQAVSNITRITTANGSITAMCLLEKPSAAIKLQLKVVR